MATPLSAASAYANIARLRRTLRRLPTRRARRGRQHRGQLRLVLKDAIGSVGERLSKSDAQTQAMANGKSNMVDVVTAVAETEVAIDAVVAVRDKVIAAYEEIMKMPI